MATAVYIKSESGDNYLYCYEETLEKEEALDKAEEDCYEVRECWSFWLVVNS